MSSSPYGTKTTWRVPLNNLELGTPAEHQITVNWDRNREGMHDLISRTGAAEATVITKQKHVGNGEPTVIEDEGASTQ